MTPIIKVKQLSKYYKIHRKEPGLRGSLQSLFSRQYETVRAVSTIDLSVAEGELVGFIGPNGAGKTTTLKMLTGLLYPTAGSIRVLGFNPWERKKEFLKQISLVMGQKAQLWWDLPLYDSLLLQRDIYEMAPRAFTASFEELSSLLDLAKFLKIQVRKLSLGQRMRGELAAALIYQPRVLFLDEPTIGLDVVVQKKIREFIAAYRRRHDATIILTSHNLDDVRALASRLIIIDHGQIAFDGQTDKLIAQHVDHKRITLTFGTPVSRQHLEPFGAIVNFQPLRAALQVPRQRTSELAAALLQKFPVEDIAIEEPRLEAVVRELFTKGDYA
ncbi:MAG: ATP-binding cassette domain-containing protein [Candidatus Andersenbacteria bacterium]|nr:ATP-binding cassette domain-containing protein [Candidatus Andersenbacteria bacterium]